MPKGREKDAGKESPDQCVGRSGQQKHEHEELKEGPGIDPVLVLLRKKTKGFGLRGIVMWPERSSWKGVGRKRGYSILAGRISVNVKLARRRKAQISTGFTTVRNEWYAKKRDIPESFRKCEQKAKTSKKE